MSSFEAITLKTPRLVLRPLREEDADDLYAIYSDARVARYLTGPAWTSIGQARERIARDIAGMATGEYLRLGVQENGRLAGECSLFNFVKQCRRAELGYALAYDCWGRGLMNEALRALVDCAFSQLSLHRIEADIDPRNVGSAKSLEQLGFTKEGYLRERWIVEGEVSDTALYGLLRSDWLSHRR